MSYKRITAAFCTSIVALAAVILTRAEEMKSADPSTPLQVTVSQSILNPDGTRNLSLQLKNTSANSIAAYALRLDILDAASGKLIAVADRTIIRSTDGPTARLGYAPGEMWSDALQVPIIGDNIQHTLSVDYVKFRTTDKPSAWGPDTRKESIRIEATIAGYRAERARLRQLLKASGTQAVIDDLAQ
ncbi:MAG TPA: hypothetical protein VFQ79_02315 [Bryobacteraceae bacterium]|nr:hypothetical protein [Bryobacteraceae bacterium]